MAAPSSALFQGRIIYKLVVQPPPLPEHHPPARGSCPSPPVPQAQRQPGCVLNWSQAQQMGAPMGSYHSGQRS